MNEDEEFVDCDSKFGHKKMQVKKITKPALPLKVRVNEFMRNSSLFMFHRDSKIR